MSNRILPSSDFSRRSLNEIVDIWSEAYEERGENIAAIGVIQLMLDRLRLSLVNNNANENNFLISESIDLRTLNMDNFISGLTTSQANQFNRAEQIADDQLFAELIVKLLGNSEEFQWITHVQRFICALLKSPKASYLVAKTTVFLYIEAVAKQNSTHLNEDFRDQMRQTSEYLSLFIAENEPTDYIVSIICDTFFDKISRDSSEIVRSDAIGCERFIVKFLSNTDVDIKIKAMMHIIRCGGIRVHGRRILRFCSRAAILREITTIITRVNGIKLRSAALDLAYHIEIAVRDRTVFPESVYQDCVLSDNEDLQRKVADLCRAMLRGGDTGVADPADVVIRATMYHQQFRKNYTTCPMRVTKTFFAEFTNWDAVFEAVELRLHDVDFIDEIFALLKRVIDHIKKNQVDVDDSLRSFSHKAIRFAQQLDRQHVTVYSNIVFSLLHADRWLELIDDRHRDVLTGFLSEIATGYFRDSFTQQLNAIYMVKVVLPIRIWQPRFEQCLNEFNAFQHQANIDFDTNANVMETFMKLGVFAWCKMIPSNTTLLCNETNGIVMADPLDLTKNRTFLAYNLIILTQSLIKVHEGAVGVRESIQGVSRTLISKRFLEILQKTEDDIDFLCVSVFWCLSKMEMKFKSISQQKVNIQILAKYLLKKISLVTIDTAHGVNHIQLQYIVFMLDQIKQLLSANVAINICDIVVGLSKRFPDSDHASNLLHFCIGIQREDMFIDCAFGVLNELPNKKFKKDFMKIIENIVNPLPNKSRIWSRILRTSLNSFGKRAQDSLDEQSAKRAKQTGQVIFNSTMKNWSSSSDSPATSRRFDAKNSTPLELNNNQIAN
ncbi:uncharacterized protein LOC129573411 [Sitodiplosis mosellana]|uniref:uncharacterized protein LOC129573411 n=1 Tax=Sitodiplosis mosellana TaxID=263140 RepID=UPI002443748F|nr:uncharacterized protein LOC129573411 [Sitodiplosis mosellana]